MSNRVIERQVVYDGKKVRLELHHLENDETGQTPQSGRFAFIRVRW